MKTTLGYFLWERVVVREDRVYFVIYWWYTPPARPIDLEIIEMTEYLLVDPDTWQSEDDRQCGADIADNRWSLFCALKYASSHKTGEFNHHNTAMQTVRNVIEEMMPRSAKRR